MWLQVPLWPFSLIRLNSYKGELLQVTKRWPHSVQLPGNVTKSTIWNIANLVTLVICPLKAMVMLPASQYISVITWTKGIHGASWILTWQRLTFSLGLSQCDTHSVCDLWYLWMTSGVAILNNTFKRAHVTTGQRWLPLPPRNHMVSSRSLRRGYLRVCQLFYQGEWGCTSPITGG